MLRPLDALSESVRDRGVDLLAVSVDERRKDVDAFLASRSHAMRVLLDPQVGAAAAFKVGAIPIPFIIDRDGRIRFTHPGYGIDEIERMKTEIATLLGE